MDCSEEVQAVFEEPTAEMELKKGMSIFIDILRRADKNDDGKLSFDEFKSYFSDGVLTAEELQELFHTIDTHNTDIVRLPLRHALKVKLEPSLPSVLLKDGATLQDIYPLKRDKGTVPTIEYFN